MRFSKLSLLGIVLFGWISVACGQVDVRMGFTTNELHNSKASTKVDTCGINSKATIGFDEGLDADRPPAVAFCTWWFIDAPEVGSPRTDMRPPPLSTAPPYAVDYALWYLPISDYDTVSISWTYINPEIDSISIDDSLPGTKAGTYIHKLISHTSPMPDSMQWIDPPPPGIALRGANGPGFRVRVYYNSSVSLVGLREVHADITPSVRLLLSPNPARNRVRIVGTMPRTPGWVVISDVLGRTVRSFANWNGTLDASLQGFASGVYMVSTMDQLAGSRALLVV